MPNPARPHPSPSGKADWDVGFIGVGALAREIGTPGTCTASGLDHLESSGVHQHWEDACALVLHGMRNTGPGHMNPQ